MGQGRIGNGIFVRALRKLPREGGRRFLMSPPPAPAAWNLRAVSLISVFYISCFVLLHSHVALFVLSFWFKQTPMKCRKSIDNKTNRTYEH